jgi:hypothetical protein
MSRSSTAGLFFPALHRQSTGALTSRAAFPSRPPTFVIAWQRPAAAASDSVQTGT